ncbi:SMR family transporter [Neisseria leonii]|uniref:DMT family transporter n=1 Tax=Neisseria leonii TaxID=2995413 RepID=UPI0030CE532D
MFSDGLKRCFEHQNGDTETWVRAGVTCWRPETGAKQRFPPAGRGDGRSIDGRRRFCLYLAQKSILIGTAYAVWTGIGAAGMFPVGCRSTAMPPP